jgi:hypothetical protein
MWDNVTLREQGSLHDTAVETSHGQHSRLKARVRACQPAMGAGMDLQHRLSCTVTLPRRSNAMDPAQRRLSVTGSVRTLPQLPNCVQIAVGNLWKCTSSHQHLFRLGHLRFRLHQMLIV